MKITFDKGLETEYVLLGEDYYEHVLTKTLNATKGFVIGEDPLPDLTGMVDRKTCETVTIEDTDGELPVIIEYHTIADFVTSCSDNPRTGKRIFSYNLTLTE